MPPIGAAPRCSPRSSPVIPFVPASVDFVDTRPAFARRLKSLLTRDPPPDRHAAYLESIGHAHPASRSFPITPAVAKRRVSLGSRPPPLPASSSSPTLPLYPPEPARRPGVALSLSLSVDSLQLPSDQTPPTCPPATSHVSRSSSLRSPVPPPASAPTCPLPPCPPLPSSFSLPPSPQISLESAIDANVLHRYSNTSNSSPCANGYYYPSSSPSESPLLLLVDTPPNNLTPLHERIFRRSRDLLNFSVSSIWSLSAEEETGTEEEGEELDQEEDESIELEKRTKGIANSLEKLTLAEQQRVVVEEEDLFDNNEATTTPNRPSLTSTSTSSSSDSTERIKFLSVFDDREPNLLTSTTSTTRTTASTGSPNLLSPPRPPRSPTRGSPSVSPKTCTKKKFEPRDESTVGRSISRKRRQPEEEEDEDDQEGEAEAEEEEVDFGKKTPGAFCWTPTEELRLDEAERERLAVIMRERVGSAGGGGGGGGVGGGGKK
ncbi:hypothetical protein JCM16303_003908 [Sporobolomyces ruberrimus]